MESLFPATNNETYYLVAEVEKSKSGEFTLLVGFLSVTIYATYCVFLYLITDLNQLTTEIPSIPPEALLSKSSQRVLSAKQKSRTASVYAFWFGA